MELQSTGNLVRTVLSGIFWALHTMPNRAIDSNRDFYVVLGTKILKWRCRRVRDIK